MKDLDFIPPSYHEAVARRRAARIQTLLGTTLIGVMASWIWIHEWRTSEVAGQWSTAATSAGEYAARTRFYDALTEEKARLTALQRLPDRLNDAASLVVLLAELSALLPDGALLTELTYKADGHYGAPSTAGGVVAASAGDRGALRGRPPLPSLHLVGAALSNMHVSAFSANLGGSPLFADVHAGAVREGSLMEHKVRQFEADARVTPQYGGTR